MKITRFEELNIWKNSLRITKLIYDISSAGSFSKDYNLRDQIRRAMISISSNIVEGFEKRNNNEFMRYLRIAKGSTGEVRNQLYIASTIGYVSKDEFDCLDKDLLELSNQIGRFLSYLMKNKQEHNFLTR